MADTMVMPAGTILEMQKEYYKCVIKMHADLMGIDQAYEACKDEAHNLYTDEEYDAIFAELTAVKA